MPDATISRSAIVRLLREPFGRPRTFPLTPGLKGRPRGGDHCFFERADQQMHPLGTEDRMALHLLLFFHRDGNGTVGREANLLALDIGDQA
jgi:hypothetical protein